MFKNQFLTYGYQTKSCHFFVFWPICFKFLLKLPWIVPLKFLEKQPPNCIPWPKKNKVKKKGQNFCKITKAVTCEFCFVVANNWFQMHRKNSGMHAFDFSWGSSFKCWDWLRSVVAIYAIWDRNWVLRKKCSPFLLIRYRFRGKIQLFTAIL